MGFLRKSVRHFLSHSLHPNRITFLRFILAPIVFFFILFNTVLAFRVAFFLYILAGITDFFDGYFARKFSIQSHLGSVLDPVADKVLVAGILLALCSIDALRGAMLWAAFVLLCREIFVSGLREFLAKLQVRMPVTRLAKWKTFFQMLSLASLLYAYAGFPLAQVMYISGLILLILAAVLTVVTGVLYFKASLKHFSQ